MWPVVTGNDSRSTSTDPSPTVGCRASAHILSCNGNLLTAVARTSAGDGLNSPLATRIQRRYPVENTGSRYR